MEYAEGKCMKMSSRFVGLCTGQLESQVCDYTCFGEGYPNGTCLSELCYCSCWICHYIHT